MHIVCTGQVAKISRASTATRPNNRYACRPKQLGPPQYRSLMEDAHVRSGLGTPHFLPRFRMPCGFLKSAVERS
jgi:hypothetical protein